MRNTRVRNGASIQDPIGMGGRGEEEEEEEREGEGEEYSLHRDRITEEGKKAWRRGRREKSAESGASAVNPGSLVVGWIGPVLFAFFLSVWVQVWVRVLGSNAGHGPYFK